MASVSLSRCAIKDKDMVEREISGEAGNNQYYGLKTEVRTPVVQAFLLVLEL